MPLGYPVRLYQLPRGRRCGPDSNRRARVNGQTRVAAGHLRPLGHRTTQSVVFVAHRLKSDQGLYHTLAYFETTCQCSRQDSNLGRAISAGLKPAPVGHLGTAAQQDRKWARQDSNLRSPATRGPKPLTFGQAWLRTHENSLQGSYFESTETMTRRHAEPCRQCEVEFA